MTTIQTPHLFNAGAMKLQAQAAARYPVFGRHPLGRYVDGKHGKHDTGADHAAIEAGW